MNAKYDLIEVQRTEDSSKKHLIRAKGKFKTFWEILMLSFSLWIALIVPLEVSFLSEYTEEYNWMDVQSIAIDVLFITDIVLNFHTSVVDHDKGVEILDKRSIAKNYIWKGSFFLDLISSIPWSIISFFFSGIKAGNLLRLFRLTRLTKLVSKFKFSKKQKDSLKLVYLFMIAIIIDHCCTCLWYSITAIEERWYPGRDRALGLSIYQEELFTQYWMCFYYVSMMMQFGGEVYPITHLETVTCLIFELIGIILMTIIYGNIIEIVSRGMKDATKLDENLSLLNSIDDRLNLPKKLVEEITDYFVNIHNSDSFREELTEFVKSLPPSLSKSVYKYLLSKCLDTHLYLKDLSLGVRYGLLSLVVPEMTNPDQVIAQQGNSANYLYFIVDGTVEVHLSTRSQKEYLQEKTPITLLRHGEDFGFCGVLNTLGRYTYTAVSQKYNSLLKLDLKKVFQLLDFDLRMVKNYKNKELLLHETHYRKSFDLMKMVPYLNPRNLEESFEIISTVHREYVPKFTELIRRGEKQYQVFYVEKGTVALKVISI